MTTGVPGTGIGSLFYFIAALLLPLRGLARRMKRLPVKWRSIAGKSALALGMLIGILVTGWFIGLVLGPLIRTAAAAAGSKVSALGRYESMVRWAALAAGYSTLAAVLLAVQIARLVTKRK